jgi:2-polyprenyl-3-methyl-5-hydroxy-6-metoxy-1,4-benzoquinol methylase
MEEVVWTPQMIADFWTFENQWPERFFSYSYSRTIVRHFRRIISAASSIVDYGAGAGWLLDDLLRTGRQCGAVDFSAEIVAAVNTNFGHRLGFVGATTEPEEWSGRFDLAFMIEVVEHLYDDDLAMCLASVRSLLRPGGVLVVTTPNEEDRSASFVRCPETGHVFHRYQHVRSWDARELSAFLEKSGFQCLECEATDFSASLHTDWRTLPILMRAGRSMAVRTLRKQRKANLYAVAVRP